MSQNPIESFRDEVKENIRAIGQDKDIQGLSRIWIREISRYKYAYNFTWMGRPIIQFPQDMVAMQELIWEIRPEVIIETGVAHGGSIIYYASLLELIGGASEVIGIDIDIRAHNRAEIERHPMGRRIKLIQASSIDQKTIERVAEIAKNKRTLVVLDSNHTHAHVLAELRGYAPMVTVGSYCVVMDTLVEDMPADFFQDRPWKVGDNPKTAVREFLKESDCFEINSEVEHKLLLTVAPSGYLRRKK